MSLAMHLEQRWPNNPFGIKCKIHKNVLKIVTKAWAGSWLLECPACLCGPVAPTADGEDASLTHAGEI